MLKKRKSTAKGKGENKNLLWSEVVDTFKQRAYRGTKKSYENYDEAMAKYREAGGTRPKPTWRQLI
jgi:hypothetical protein